MFHIIFYSYCCDVIIKIKNIYWGIIEPYLVKNAEHFIDYIKSYLQLNAWQLQ